MKKYEWILFDADNTLFHFDAFRGLKIMMTQFGINFTEKDYQKYQTLNKSLWAEYQDKKISAQQLQGQRFEPWANRLQTPAHVLNSAYLTAMAEICMPIDGAISLLNSLRGKSKLGIITNGFTELQQARLNRTGLQNHFDLLVISEEVGVAKPHLDIFEHVFSLMNNPNREKILMVGDTLETDILGGINAGLDTCWINQQNKVAPNHIKPSYQVSSLTQLERLLTVLIQ